MNKTALDAFDYLELISNCLSIASDVDSLAYQCSSQKIINNFKCSVFSQQLALREEVNEIYFKYFV